MKAVSVSEDAIVVTSLMWQTNAIALRAGEECVLIDSPYFPDELEALPALLGQGGFEPDGLLATHGDFDHLLGRLAFPGMALGVAESTALRLQGEPGAAQRELRDFDSNHYVTRPRPLTLGQVQPLPVPGKVELGDHELELYVAEGHTVDGMAVFAPWLGVLCVGDYISGVEIPWISDGGSVGEYRATLERLATVVERAAVIVPGHGGLHDSATARRLIEEDLEYLDTIELGDERQQLPPGRDSSFQRKIHRANIE